MQGLNKTRELLNELIEKDRISTAGRPTTDSDVQKALNEIECAERNLLGKVSIIVAVIALIIALSSCTTARNATKRHERMVKNFPFVHQIDTFIYQLIDTIEIEGIKGVDTMYFDISRIDTIRDTFYLKDSTMVINTIWKRDGSNYALKTDIRQPNKVKVIHREIKIPVIVEKPDFYDKLAWVTVGICIGIMLTFGLTWFVLFRNRKK